MKSTRFLRLAVTLLFLASLAIAQDIDIDSVTASEELRWGVRAFHNGFYNEAILSLNRSLAFDPEAVLARFWLGRAYYYSGFEEAGLQEWRTILQSDAATSHLSTFVDIVESRRGLGRELTGPPRYVVATRVEGVQAETVLFRGPTSVRPRVDGSYFVVGFANHLIQRVGVNGTVQRTLTGGLEGFDRPFDIYEAEDGTLFVSEFGADRISHCRPDGTKIATFGTAGIHDGQLLGPQYIVGDDDGFLYVSDTGNSRISKFTTDGRFVLSFGSQTPFFSGLGDPVGVAFVDGRIFVLDAARATIEIFDTSGNHISTLENLGIQRPEGLSVGADGYLLVADGSRVVEFDPETETTRVIGDGSGDTFTFAVTDANGNLLASDFENDEIVVYAGIDSLYAGLFVRVDRIQSNSFPEILLDVTVQDRNGRPIVGLGARNFLLTEGQGSVDEVELTFSTDSATRFDLSVLVDRSLEMAENGDRLREAVRRILGSLQPDDRRWLVTAGPQPVIDAGPGVGNLEFVDRAVGAGEYAASWAFDLGVRLAASELIQQRGRRGIVYVTQGSLSSNSFSRYGLVELMQFLRNNDVPFYPVYLDGGSSVPELEYLARETGGMSAALRQPEGLTPVFDHLRNRTTGRYTFSYVSPSNSDFGRAYIPTEVEAFLLTRSGRDEVGYYAPLEF